LLNFMAKVKSKYVCHGSLTLVIEDLLFKGLKSLNFFVKF